MSEEEKEERIDERFERVLGYKFSSLEELKSQFGENIIILEGVKEAEEYDTMVLGKYNKHFPENDYLYRYDKRYTMIDKKPVFFLEREEIVSHEEMLRLQFYCACPSCNSYSPLRCFRVCPCCCGCLQSDSWSQKCLDESRKNYLEKKTLSNVNICRFFIAMIPLFFLFYFCFGFDLGFIIKAIREITEKFSNGFI